MDTIDWATRGDHFGLDDQTMSDMDAIDDDNQTKIIDLCPNSVPTFMVYIMNLSTEYFIVFGILGILVMAILINYLEELHYLYKHSSRWQLRDKAKWLLAVYPIVAFTSFNALIAPRTAGLNELVASIYVAVCVYVFIVMIIDQYGGPYSMYKQLQKREFRVNPPPLCCFVCFPTCSVNKVHLQVIHALVLQFVIIRPFLGYIIALMWTDGSYGDTEEAEQSPQTYIMFVYSMSTLMAMYGFLLVKDQSMKLLSTIHIRAKYFSLQAVLLIVGLQRSIVMTVFMIFDVNCEPPLHIESTVDRYNHMIIIFEMTLLAIVARIYYRHASQAYIGQLATKYRRRTEQIRKVFSHSVDHFHRQNRHSASENETPSEQSSDDSVRADDVIITVHHEEQDKIQQKVEIDSGYSTFDENSVVHRF